MKKVSDALSTRRQKSIISSHHFPTLLWLLMRVAAVLVATRCLVRVLYSEAVNGVVYRWIFDFEPGAVEYRSGLSLSDATLADSLGSFSFSVQVGWQ
jgi:hypothetical protein